MNIMQILREFPTRNEIKERKERSKYRLDNTDLYHFILRKMISTIRNYTFNKAMLDLVFNFYLDAIARDFEDGIYSNYIYNNWNTIMRDIQDVIRIELCYIEIEIYPNKFTMRIIG